MDDFIKIANNFGIPWALFAVVVIFLWRVLVRIDRVFLDPEKGADGKPKGWAIRAFSSLEENSILQSRTLEKLEIESKHKEEQLNEIKEIGHEVVTQLDRVEEKIDDFRKQ